MNEKRFKLAYEKGNEAIFEDLAHLYPRRMTNKEVENLLNEQQATIRKLQDLCGKSDGENMKLRIENKRLQKELNDCEKFRYTTFKRMRDVLDE